MRASACGKNNQNMGREIRKVPVGWEHPKRTEWNREKDFHPLYDRPYRLAAEEWIKDFLEWQNGDDPKKAEYPYYWDYGRTPPDKEYYRPEWADEEMNGFCLYETVSEGTPVSPVFETRKELAEYLAKHGDFWDQKRGHGGWGIEQATAFCAVGWAPSGIASAEIGYVEGKLSPCLQKINPEQ
jgi:hypothetical protein